MPANEISKWASAIVTLGAVWAAAGTYVLPSVPMTLQSINLGVAILLIVTSGYYAGFSLTDRVPYRGAAGLAVLAGSGLVVIPALATSPVETPFLVTDVAVGGFAVIVYSYEILSGEGHTTPFGGTSSA